MHVYDYNEINLSLSLTTVIKDAFLIEKVNNFAKTISLLRHLVFSLSVNKYFIYIVVIFLT